MKLTAPYRTAASQRSGAALIITLAFVVLLSALVLIYLTQAVNYRLLSNGSLNDFKSSTIGQSALETVTGDLIQEIVNGSATPTTYGTGTNSQTVYTPTTNTYMVPQRTLIGGIAPFPNLVRWSQRSDTIASPAVGSRASAASSTNAAYYGQYISPDRWNKHYLLPLASPGTTAVSTTPTNTFIAPDRVYVTSRGPTVLTAPTNTVIGRYAYAIYDEGGLLDVNVAGFPDQGTGTPMPVSTTHPSPIPTALPLWGSGLKGSESFADLTVIDPATQAPILTQPQIDQLVGWRNNFSAQPTGTFASGYSFSSASALAYHDNSATNATGFLTNAIIGAAPTTFTDQRFLSRQALIQFFIAESFPQDSLQYLATFTRDIDQPSYNPPVGRPMVQSSTTVNATTFGTGNDAFQLDRVSTTPTTNAPSDINPPFLNVRVTTSFTRADGTTANVGDPLIKERFPLSRLSLFPTNEAAPSTANAALIQQYFGLTRQSSGVWFYNHDPNNTTGIDRLSPTASSSTIGVTVQGREPDFFELLKAAINVGSVGKGSAYNESNVSNDNYTTVGSVGYLQQARDTLTALQILQIGANIIDQSKADNFPTRIQFSGDTSSPPNIVCGSQDLPYLYRIRNWISQYGATAATSQVAYLIQPELWDPYAYNSAASSGLGSSAFVAATSTPKNFRVRLEPDPSLTSTATPINISVTYTTGPVVPLTDISLNAPNYKSTAAGAPNPAPLTFTAGELNGNWGFREPTLLAVPALVPTAGINAGNTLSPWSDIDLNTGATMTGFLIATFPWENTTVSPTDNANKITVTPSAEPSCLRCYLEYQDPNNPSNYIVYDQQVIQYQGNASGTDVHVINNVINNTYAKCLASDNYDDCGWIRTDPRTSRWGAMYSQYFYSLPTINSTLYEFGSQRSDGGISFASHLGGVSDASFVNPHANYGAQYEGFQQGYWAENSTRKTYQTDSETGASADLRYNLDPDGIPRRAMAGYVTDTLNGGVTPTTASQPLTGLPMAVGGTATVGSGTVNNANAGTTTSALSPAYSSRPTILHRPFRSVAELGYAFRESPWGNINFMYPESGDSALLDVFCINPTSDANALVAGRVNLNSHQAPVLAALLSGTLRDKDDLTTPVLTQTMASDLATQLVTRTSATGVSSTTPSTTQGPLMSRADLVGTWTGSGTPATSDTNLKSAAAAFTISPDTFYTGFSYDIGISAVTSVHEQSPPTVSLIPRQRNAVMCALTDCGTARTWNLLIDLVAQSGRFPPNTTNLNNFVVDGEKHYWFHVAIDRYTGKILDSQLEVVKE